MSGMETKHSFMQFFTKVNNQKQMKDLCLEYSRLVSAVQSCRGGTAQRWCNVILHVAPFVCSR